MRKKLIIFDLDGTLINTVYDLNASVNYALNKLNYPIRTIQQTTNDIGNGVPKLIERSIPNGLDNKDYDECLRIFKEHYLKHYFDKSRPYPGVKELMVELKARGYLLAVVSNKFDEGAKKLVNHYYENLFDHIQGSLDNLRKKPYRDLVDLTLSTLKVDNKDALYVGDTEVDYLTAINSHLDCVLVTYGYRTKTQLLEKTKNTSFIDVPIELLNYLD